jgi:hypothetical protein
MENRSSVPDLAKMSMVVDFEFILPIDAVLHNFYQGVDLILGEGSFECDR